MTRIYVMKHLNRLYQVSLASIIFSISLGLALFIVNPIVAQDFIESENRLHPSFPLLDSAGVNVLESGNPISTMQTCGTCHDTDFIADHSLHADIGFSSVSQDIEGVSWYGDWNAITYASPDLPIEEWVQTYGWRHVGGGPAVEVGVEMNCFICHINEADNESRITALESGQFTWASTATLNQTGIVQPNDDTWVYNPSAFNDDGELLSQYVTVAQPANDNCGFCHGVVGDNAQIPLEFDLYDQNQWHTLTTGQVFSPERLNNSGVNLAGKSDLNRSWDVHAERLVGCTDCHYSLNNPIFYVESDESRPDHLQFDPRRMDFEDYLTRPLHQFANGGENATDIFPIFERADRDCATCHDAESTHSWLPYATRHIQVMECETCHIPELFAPALESVDWTVINTDGSPQMTYRGVEDGSQPPLVTGFTPVLLTNNQGKLAPNNLVSVWYWVDGALAQPIDSETLKSIWLDDDDYVREILHIFDLDKNGTLSDTEQIIDSNEKKAVIEERLIAEGYENPRIVGEVSAYSISHNVTHGEWATSDCSTCHTTDSLINQPMSLSNRLPGNVQPVFSDISGDFFTDENGILYFQPSAQDENENLYILGYDSVSWIDWLGILLFLGTMFGVFVHGGLRYMIARRMTPPEEPELREVYMYSVYERQWHWLQTAVIFGLLITGLIIHKPDMFSMFYFSGVVFFHNAFALILLVNAALAAFYHLASGEIQQFLPTPHGFFNDMFAQAKYYLWGIFKGEPHPFEKTRNRKLNPIQQMTYFGLLNVLLPLQIITGTLMWGAQHIPSVTDLLGGLAFLAPIHTLISWLLVSFIVMHVYMTTTGHTPLANIRAMMMGWDEVEVHETTTGEN